MNWQAVHLHLNPSLGERPVSIETKRSETAQAANQCLSYIKKNYEPEYRKSKSEIKEEPATAFFFCHPSSSVKKYVLRIYLLISNCKRVSTLVRLTLIQITSSSNFITR